MPVVSKTGSAMDDYLVVGKVIGYYGVKGWVKIKSFTQPEQNILDCRHCFIKKDGLWSAAEIENSKIHGKSVVVKFKGFEDRTTVEKKGKFEIAVLASTLPKLDEDDYYWYELENLYVWMGDLLLGQVSHLLETGSNDVLVVRACDGSIDERERLLPYRPEVVMNIDLDTSKIEVNWDPDF